ncbi:hypothetical protein R1sor_004590 [Riccia sorocarpa]|uniref:SANTA domain-containing protein n=1 Tax=Riccia sorocarpa TaxID=122646 RepID=A0ABD3HL44_9MARC
MECARENHAFCNADTNLSYEGRLMIPCGEMSSLRHSATQRMSERFCESNILRRGLDAARNVRVSHCFSPDCRRSCESLNGSLRTPSHFQDRVAFHDELAEGVSRMRVNCGEKPVPFCSASRGSEPAGNFGGDGHGPEHVGENERPSKEDKCRHREVPEAGQRCSPAVCNCFRCIVMARAISLVGEKGCGFDNRVHETRQCSGSSPAGAAVHRVSPDNSGRKASTMSRNGTLSDSRTSSKSTAADMVQSKSKKKQVSFFGWFLKRPTPAQQNNSTPGSSSLQQVAIGGYKTDRTRENDYFESGVIIERLERWRLLTSDGVVVALMGMINIAKTVESGFPAALAQCFVIGFPSAWNDLILIHSAVPPGSRSSESPSSFCAANNKHRPEQENKVVSSVPEADPVRAVLSSPLFMTPVCRSWSSVRHLSPICGSVVHKGSVPCQASVHQADTIGKDLEKQTGIEVKICCSATKAENIEREAPQPAESPASPYPGTPKTGSLNAGPLPKEVSNKVPVIPEMRAGKDVGIYMDWQELLRDGSCQACEGEAQNRPCDNVATVHVRLSEVVMTEEVCMYSHLGDAHLKRACPCARRAGSDSTRVSSCEIQDRESRVLLAKGNPNEELSSSRVGTAPLSGRNSVLETAPSHTRSDKGKRPLEESLPVEIDQERKRACDTGNRSLDVSNQEETDGEREPKEVDAKGNRLCDTGKRPLEESSSEEMVRERKRVCDTRSLSKVPKGHPHVETSDRLPEHLGNTTLDACLNLDCIPCTPLLANKKRPRIETESPWVQQEVRDEDVLYPNVGEPVPEVNDAEKLKDDGVTIFSADEQALNVMGETEGHDDLEVTEEGPTSAELKGFAGPSVMPYEESNDIVMEPADEICADACVDVITQNAASLKGKEKLIDDLEAKHSDDLCVDEARDQQKGSSSKHTRKPAKRKVRYYPGPRKRRVRVVRKDSLKAEDVEGENDRCGTTEESPVVPQKHGEQVSTRKSHCEDGSGSSRGKDGECSSERLGERINGESRGEPEEAVRITRSSTRCKTADRSSAPSCQLPSKRGSQNASHSPSCGVPDTTGTMVTEAFGLKRSRHGRVIVPRLASWLSQSIKYDMDGSIIGISEGFEPAKEELGTGRGRFEPPSDKEAIAKRKKLERAAKLKQKRK